jgi:oligopeptide/dipeptide ABC transporter ATP-binding protein
VNDVLLSVEGLTKLFPVGRALFGRSNHYVRAVDGVSFQLRRGEVLGLVGESGCGKSTTGRSILRLIEPTGGRIIFDGTDVTALAAEPLRRVRRRLQIVFQDPYSSLNPRMRIGRLLREPLVVHGTTSRSEIDDRVATMLDKVGLRADHARRYPHELSGGQRQRVGIARALIAGPDLVVADEPVSALDASIQAQVLNLLEDLRDELRLSLLLISHNIAVVQHACDRIAVMYLGQIVEVAPADDVVMAPRHPYTEALISAVPLPEPGAARDRVVLKGDVPNPANPPAGCRFHTRCPHARHDCASVVPPLREVAPGHFAACHYSEAIYGVSETPESPAAGALERNGASGATVSE